jgi:hypothetical protein
MDIGFSDLTAVLFGYYDFENGVLVIEDEFSINGPELTSKKLAKLIMEYEDRIFTSPITGEFNKPYLRISDNNMILINDLQKDHNLTFLPTDKHNKESYLNQMRNAIAGRQIIIHPKCTQLIAHLRKATWNKNRTDYKRSEDSGHYDFVDSLLYMVRNINKDRNPYPKGYNHSLLGRPDSVFKGHLSKTTTDSSLQKLEKMFQPRTTFKKAR